MKKASRYNWILEHEGSTFIFNGASGCLAEVGDTLAPSVHQLLSSDTPGELLGTIPKDLSTGLVEGGFVIDDEIDERSVLRHISLIPRYSPEPAGVTAVVTTRCNFACPYCTQDTGTGRDMPPEVVDKLISIIDLTNSRQFSITLYGGEPLLVPEICDDICLRASEACKRRGIDLDIDMVTNGYLLDEQLASKLASHGLTSVQITVDGNKKHHDHRRVLKGGKGTYDRVVSHALSAARHLDVAIRVNLEASLHSSRESIADVECVFRDIDRVTLYVSPTRLKDEEASSANLKQSCGCFSDLFLRRRKLHARLGGCCAVRLDSFVLLPDGSFASCWDDVGILGSGFGSILDSGIPKLSHRAKWMDWDPYGTQPCRDCLWLPTCGGGCPRVWLESGSPGCLFGSDEEYRHFIMVNVIARRQKGGSSERG
jgi:uncharacterized protein